MTKHWPRSCPMCALWNYFLFAVFCFHACFWRGGATKNASVLTLSWPWWRGQPLSHRCWMLGGSSQTAPASSAPIWSCFSTKNSESSVWASAASACCRNSFGLVFGRGSAWITVKVSSYCVQFSWGLRPSNSIYQANYPTQSCSSFLVFGFVPGIFAIGDCNYTSPHIRAHYSSFALLRGLIACWGCFIRWHPPSSALSNSSSAWAVLVASPTHPTSTWY